MSASSHAYLCVVIVFLVKRNVKRIVGYRLQISIFILMTFVSLDCRDPSPWETRGTQLIVTRGTCYQPDHHYPDSPKDMHGVDILSGPPQGKANDVSSSPIQGRANDAGRAYTSG